MIKAIIFDCFGVVYEDAFERAYRSLGGDPVKDRDFIIQTFDDSHSGRTASSSPHFAKKLGITLEEWNNGSRGLGSFNHELLDYVGHLKQDYAIAMLSNVSSTGLSAHMDVEVLKKYFDPIVESSAIGYAKPNPKAYTIVADILSVASEECIMVDDREPYLAGAKAVGMKTILYTNFEEFKTKLEKLV